MKLGFLYVRNPQPEKHMFVPCLSGIIPWSSATHVELGTWVSLSRAGVPQLIASSFCISQDSGVDKNEALTRYFLQHEAEGKGNILTLGSLKNTVLSLPCDINYLSRLQIRLIGVFTFNHLIIPFLQPRLLSWELHFLWPWAVQSFTQTFGFSASSQ